MVCVAAMRTSVPHRGGWDARGHGGSKKSRLGSQGPRRLWLAFHVGCGGWSAGETSHPCPSDTPGLPRHGSPTELGPCWGPQPHPALTTPHSPQARTAPRSSSGLSAGLALGPKSVGEAGSGVRPSAMLGDQGGGPLAWFGGGAYRVRLLQTDWPSGEAPAGRSAPTHRPHCQLLPGRWPGRGMGRGPPLTGRPGPGHLVVHLPVASGPRLYWHKLESF